jgi:hypothetical protein
MAKKVIIRGTAEYRRWMFLGLGLGLAALIALPFVVSSFRTFQFTMALIWAVAVLGLNLLTGYSGQISLGHSAFFGVGAYTSAILISDYGWYHLLTLPVAGALAFIAGFAVGLPALRLAGLYLALMTLALAVAFPALARRFDGLTDGVMGKNVSSRDVQVPSWLPFTRDVYLYFVVLIVLVLMLVLARNMIKSRVGRALTALARQRDPCPDTGRVPGSLQDAGLCDQCVLRRCGGRAVCPRDSVHEPAVFLAHFVHFDSCWHGGGWPGHYRRSNPRWLVHPVRAVLRRRSE